MQLSYGQVQLSYGQVPVKLELNNAFGEQEELCLTSGATDWPLAHSSFAVKRYNTLTCCSQRLRVRKALRYSKSAVSLITLTCLGGCKYFYATLQLGSSSRSFEVNVNTDSIITYVPCASYGTEWGSQLAVRPCNVHNFQPALEHLISPD